MCVCVQEAMWPWALHRKKSEKTKKNNKKQKKRHYGVACLGFLCKLFLAPERSQ